jgi:pimeloyl-ACP methyl ester carboxylesterase
MAIDGTTPYGPFTLRWREERGDEHRPRILLLHGIYASASRYEWDPLLAHLAGRYRVRAADLLGFGASDHPDLEHTPDVVLGAVRALIADAADGARPPVVVASSLTGAYAVRAVARGAAADRLALITPTGLGRSQVHPAGAGGRAFYSVARHTLLGDVLSRGLTSRPSIRWFLRQQAYADPAKVTDEVVATYHDLGKVPNAKQAQLAFVAGLLALPLEPGEVAATRPFVVWARGQAFSRDRDAQAWRDAGAVVVAVDAGLPQSEAPGELAALLASHLEGDRTDAPG